jgi:hypothetical protein
VLPYRFPDSEDPAPSPVRTHGAVTPPAAAASGANAGVGKAAPNLAGNKRVPQHQQQHQQGEGRVSPRPAVAATPAKKRRVVADDGDEQQGGGAGCVAGASCAGGRRCSMVGLVDSQYEGAGAGGAHGGEQQGVEGVEQDQGNDGEEAISAAPATWHCQGSSHHHHAAAETPAVALPTRSGQEGGGPVPDAGARKQAAGTPGSTKDSGPVASVQMPPSGSGQAQQPASHQAGSMQPPRGPFWPMHYCAAPEAMLAAPQGSAQGVDSTHWVSVIGCLRRCLSSRHCLRLLSEQHDLKWL